MASSGRLVRRLISRSTAWMIKTRDRALISGMWKFSLRDTASRRSSIRPRTTTTGAFRIDHLDRPAQLDGAGNGRASKVVQRTEVGVQRHPCLGPDRVMAPADLLRSIPFLLVVALDVKRVVAVFRPPRHGEVAPLAVPEPAWHIMHRGAAVGEDIPRLVVAGAFEHHVRAFDELPAVRAGLHAPLHPRMQQPVSGRAAPAGSQAVHFFRFGEIVADSA